MAIKRPPVAVLIAAHIQAQPRKAAVLGVLFVVMVGIYARNYVWSTGPRRADAHSRADIEGLAERAAGNVRQRPERVSIDLPERRELRRDPFRIDLSRYPTHQPALQHDAREAIADSLDTDAIRAKAEGLTLQSILWQDNGNAVACIAGRMVRPGDSIEGFTVRRVEPTRVLLEKDGCRLVLTWR